MIWLFTSGNLCYLPLSFFKKVQPFFYSSFLKVLSTDKISFCKFVSRNRLRSSKGPHSVARRGSEEAVAAVFYHRTEALTRFLLRKMLNLAQVWRIGKHLTYPTCAYGACIYRHKYSIFWGRTNTAWPRFHTQNRKSFWSAPQLAT